MIKTAAIIQARMTSTRLPGKVLMDISGKPMLWHVINRMRFSNNIGDVILAIPDNKENDPLEVFAKGNGMKFFRGSEEDVLSRYYFAAKSFLIENIVRVSSDCPLIDPAVNDLVIEKYFAMDLDYMTNTLNRTFPRGLDVEIFNFRSLQISYNEAKTPAQREHPTLFIRENPKFFKRDNLESEKDYSNMRWTVDEKEDLEFVREIYSVLYPKKEIFLMDDVVELLKENPQILKINSNIRQKKITH